MKITAPNGGVVHSYSPRRYLVIQQWAEITDKKVRDRARVIFRTDDAGRALVWAKHRSCAIYDSHEDRWV